MIAPPHWASGLHCESLLNQVGRHYCLDTHLKQCMVSTPQLQCRLIVSFWQLARSLQNLHIDIKRLPICEPGFGIHIVPSVVYEHLLSLNISGYRAGFRLGNFPSDLLTVSGALTFCACITASIGRRLTLIQISPRQPRSLPIPVPHHLENGISGKRPHCT